MTHQHQANTMARAIGYKGFDHCQRLHPSQAALIAKMALALERDHIETQSKIARNAIAEAQQKLKRLERLSGLNEHYKDQMNGIKA